jgi:hypothetical protein
VYCRTPDLSRHIPGNSTHWQRLINLLSSLLHSVGQTLYVGKNRPRHEANNWPTCVFEMGHSWDYISIPYTLTASCLIRYKKSFPFRRIVHRHIQCRIVLSDPVALKIQQHLPFQYSEQQVKDSGLLTFSAVYFETCMSCLGTNRLLSSLLYFRFESKEIETASSFQ